MKKVKIVNNWEYYEYYVDGNEINAYSIKTIYDNQGNKYDVTHKTENSSYNDMGRTYFTKRVVLCVNHPLGEIILRPKSEFYIE